MPRPRSLTTIFAAGLLTGFLPACDMIRAHAISHREPPQQIEAPKPKEVISPDTTIAEARRLSQQGKFDEAIGELKGLAAKQPDYRGTLA